MTSGPANGDEGFLSLAGHLLIATPLLIDPNFFRAVVYIVEHSPEGALGVVLNRPSEERVSDHLPDWNGLLNEPSVVFIGGPVANDIALGVVTNPDVPPESWDPTQDGVGLVDLSEGPGKLGGVASARVYSGYSGWVRGQLELELRTGSWVVAAGGADDVFTAEPDTLWRAVLRRLPDRRALYASYPDDLGSN